MVIYRSHGGSQLMGHSFPLSNTAGMQQNGRGIPQELFIFLHLLFDIFCLFLKIKQENNILKI
jgi:hypothetical protein